MRSTKLKVVKHGQVISILAISIEFIKTITVSRMHRHLLFIHRQESIVHTGDFKVDYTPVFGDAIDLAAFCRDRKKGCARTDV